MWFLSLRWFPISKRQGALVSLFVPDKRDTPIMPQARKEYKPYSGYSSGERSFFLSELRKSHHPW
jgi:hypothetical protein